TPFRLLILSEPGKTPSLIARFRYVGDDWVFADEFTLHIDDKNMVYKKSQLATLTEILSGGNVLEQASFDITDNYELQKLLLSPSKSGTVRFRGKYTADKSFLSIACYAMTIAYYMHRYENVQFSGEQ